MKFGGKPTIADKMAAASKRVTPTRKDTDSKAPKMTIKPTVSRKGGGTIGIKGKVKF